MFGLKEKKRKKARRPRSIQTGPDPPFNPASQPPPCIPPLSAQQHASGFLGSHTDIRGRRCHRGCHPACVPSKPHHVPAHHLLHAAATAAASPRCPAGSQRSLFPGGALEPRVSAALAAGRHRVGVPQLGALAAAGFGGPGAPRLPQGPHCAVVSVSV